MKKKKSLKKILNKIGPTIVPCGTPDVIVRKLLFMKLPFTNCLLFFKYEQIYSNVFSFIGIQFNGIRLTASSVETNTLILNATIQYVLATKRFEEALL